MISNQTLTQEDFNSLSRYYADPGLLLQWNLVFTLPAWLKTWWQNFGSGAELSIQSVRQGADLLGIAPLQIRQGVASIIGNVDVCDYQDFIVVPGREREFYNAVLDDLKQRHVTALHLETVRPDSNVVTRLMPLAQERGYSVEYRQTDVSSDIALPTSWDDYLEMMDSKQRHELKRKIRNLQRLGDITYRAIEERQAVLQAMETFLKLFPESRGDKAQFMTPAMQTYFRSLTEALAEIDIVRFGILESGNKPLAMVMYFDYNENIYLYNSAYDPDYKSMSVGIISKARCIQDSIEKGKKRFDFLKGPEQYKYYLGGQEIPLYSCHITL